MKVDIIKLSQMIDEKRLRHSEGVRDMAVKLAEIYGADADKAETAGILHDCAKNIPHETAIKLCREKSIPIPDICVEEPSLVHAFLGAYIAEHEFGITDSEILSAIRKHTTGSENMTLLEKIICLADLTECGRTIEGVDKIRELSYSDLDGALIMAFSETISHVLRKNGEIDTETVKARNYLISKRRKK